jgi:hypothetical protein
MNQTFRAMLLSLNPFGIRSGSCFNHFRLSDTAQKQQEQTRHEGAHTLETGALPIELRPYRCAMMIAKREGFVKAIFVPKLFGLDRDSFNFGHICRLRLCL